MSQLRQNPATKEWVIIATDRSKRPGDFCDTVCPPPTNDVEHCPFCPGNEKKTPPEVFSYRTYETKADSPGWWVRVIPNKFAALEPKGKIERSKIDHFFLHMDGLGRHEVLIESPEHDKCLATMSEKQVEDIFLAYRERSIALSKDKNSELVIIFENHGKNAGTSLEHPHSQIIATPVTPMRVRHLVEEAMRYFDDHGTCVYCAMAEKELALKERIVLESDNFLVFQPFASRSPFETWILPKKHESNFDNISPELAKELAFIVRKTLLKIYKGLNNPDYNLMVFSSPCHERDVEYYHWRIQILPRISSMAGFELGTGIYINTVIPEEAAKFLRDVEVE